MSVGILTTAGLSAMLTAQMNNTAFAPDVVQVSSDVLTLTGAETSLSNIVWTAPSSAITQVSPETNLFRTIVFMDSNVGTFNVGTIGISTADGTLFAAAVFPGAGKKIANNFPSVVGNIRTFYLDVSYADISGQFTSNLTTITNDTLISILNSGIITAGLFLSGSGPPAIQIGQYGCMYLDTANNLLYGPLTAVGWGGGRRITS